MRQRAGIQGIPPLPNAPPPRGRGSETTLPLLGGLPAPRGTNAYSHLVAQVTIRVIRAWKGQRLSSHTRELRNAPAGPGRSMWSPGQGARYPEERT